MGCLLVLPLCACATCVWHDRRNRLILVQCKKRLAQDVVLCVVQYSFAELE